MSQNNSRIIEKDLFADLTTTESGDSEIIDLFGSSGGANKFSCQAIYDVQTPAAKNFDPEDVDLDEDTVTITAHGFTTGFKVRLTTTDTLPDPLQLATDYFIIVVDANTIQFASSLANALAGVAIDLLDDGAPGSVNTVTGVALAGASITFRKSNDGTNWIDVQAATAIAADGSVMIEQANVSYRYFKCVKALTAGQVDLKALVCVLGDAT